MTSFKKMKVSLWVINIQKNLMIYQPLHPIQSAERVIFLRKNTFDKQFPEQ